ncbi:MAG TPA: PVC-type heme-binding CxxCH protein [Tepidisphaeraceae bacterium]|nr:PVC-type heme-binding CxxCH protein [Tepidisphaeraceae bacterium]
MLLTAGLLGWMRFAGADDAKPAEAAAVAPRRVKVLFLGDNGHHVPLERCRDAMSEMGKRGVDLVYTDDLNDLNTPNLNRYDVLLLYANWTKIKPEQEQALLDYVQSGHGFAPIHCGSYCFLNSPKITALIGGRFKSHKTGVFKETIVLPDHPIEKGLKPIESWDESYVHEMHNEQNRTVLSYRIEGDHKEPYTWTRTEGKGRVFYTAWGHDERTWTNPDFQNLLERGIRWAAGDWALEPQPKLNDFTYSPAKVPFYPAGEKWGTTADPFKTMQDPLPARESMKHIVVRPGFEVKLVASDPDIKKPICMAFDERGRLWVAETFDYPNNMQEPGQGHDQIKICESTKGDGVADKFTVFADKLSIPTSMCFANGGLIVTQAPDLLFLKDSTGGDHADVRKVLFTGWGTRDTHAGPSNLRYGFDGWVYGTVGYSGFDGEVGGEHVRFGAGPFRFKPDGSKLEYLGTTTNNTWGLGFTEDDNLIGSTANDVPAWHADIPNRYYENLRGWPTHRFETIADTPHIYPITNKVRQVDHHGSYTAGAGSALYTARSFPKSYWDRIAFVAEPTGHLLGQYIYERKGTAFTARDDFSLLASDDEWCAPINGEVGPDGALWMIDWYNYIVQHNPIPKGWVSGKGGAYETDLRDKRHGRVYRIIWTDGKPSKAFDLTKANNDTLLEALKSDNMLWRMHAQRLLTEKGDKSVLPALVKLAGDKSVDEIGLNPTAIHALWTIHNLGGFEGGNADALAVASADLKHPSAGVRQAAVEVLPPTADSVAAILKSGVLSDHDAFIRKNALLALSEMPANDTAGAAVYSIVKSLKADDDRGLADASAFAAAGQAPGFLQAAFAAHPGNGSEAQSTQAKVEAVNLLPNPSFEEVTDKLPTGWRIRDYAGEATHETVKGGHSGDHALRITSKSGSDASMFVDVPLQPRTDYVLSAWIKTQKVTGAMGALLNVHGTPYKTPAVTGTSDWQKVEVAFNSGPMTKASINCLFGGWGQSKGTAYYDDVKLVSGKPSPIAGIEGRVISAVVSHYAREAPGDSVVGMLQAATHADPGLAEVVVDGLANGWPQGKAPKLADADVKQLNDVMQALPSNARDGLIALAGRWGRADLFGNASAGVVENLRKTVIDSKLEGIQRVDAGRRLVMIADSPATEDLVLSQITPTQPPQVQTGLIKALSQSRSAELGKVLVDHYGQFTPAAQKETLALLIEKTNWSGALLAGIDSGKIDNRDIEQTQWTVLKSNPDEAIAKKAAELQKKTGHAPSADRKEIVEKFTPLAEKQGDPAKGRLVFEANCMICHTIEGKGGHVGPELTGIGARPKADLIGKILDPNRSIEGTYRQWIVRTKSGDVTAGRIFAENKTSIQILDATAKITEIQREDIDRLVPTAKTLMPEGFEQLGEDKLVDLLAFLGTSKVKH